MSAPGVNDDVTQYNLDILQSCWKLQSSAFAVVPTGAQLLIKKKLYASEQALLPSEKDALRRVGGHIGKD